jgi:signal transduction histidine kinase
MVSLPGALLLVAAAIVVAALIFSPSRRRLQALESAAERLGAGDLTARAPERGADEIARVARAFNTMAAELSVRDQALRTSDRLRRQMVADVSHELKTPLTSMRGYVETLRIPDIALSPQQRGQYLDTIERETRRLERIVQDLLDIARIENDAIALNQRYFDTWRLFQHVVERHHAAVDARGVRLATLVSDEADQLFGDPVRMSRSNSCRVRSTAAPRTVTWRFCTSMASSPAAMYASAGADSPPARLCRRRSASTRASSSRIRNGLAT